MVMKGRAKEWRPGRRLCDEMRESGLSGWKELVFEAQPWSEKCLTHSNRPAFYHGDLSTAIKVVV